MKMSRLEKVLVNRRSKGVGNVAVVERQLARLDVPGGGSALELGCGAGEVSAHLARERGYRVTGADVDPAQVALARSRYGEDDQLRFVIADAADLPVPAASTDLVVAQNVFHHLPHWREAVSELARVLRPGGHVLWLDLTPPSWLETMLRPARTRLGVYTLPQVRTAFRDAGFTEVIVRQLSPWVPIRHEVVLRKETAP
jgi:ubiquinone/menaquinone biosynthesis C-methylase UbiE